MPYIRPFRLLAPLRPWPARDAGFSLVELAIVVLIVSILLTMGLATFSAQMDSAALSATQRRQETIKEALVAYLRTNKRLPCPETTALGGLPPTGIESRQNVISGEPDPTSLCVSFWGTLPFTTLGLPRDTVLDGYGNFFTYFTSNAESTAQPDWTLSLVPGFNVGNSGRFSITENGTPTTLANNLAAAVIVSHGKNGSGAFTLKGTRISPPTGANELANAPDITANTPPAWTAPAGTGGCLGTCPSPGIRILFIKSWTDDPSSPGGIFDDVVFVLRPNDLLGPIIKDGAMKSAEAQIQEQLVSVRDTAIAEMLSTCTPPTTLPQPVDPWGSLINYAKVGSSAFTASSLPDSTAFQVWSSGPNRSDNNGALDDKSLSTRDVTYGQVRARIPLPICP